MKLWYEHAADHSANLRIVGRFQTAADAQEAAALINEVLDITSRPQTYAQGCTFSNEILDFVKRTNFPFSEAALKSVQYQEPVAAAGNEIEVRTDDVEIQLLLEAVIHSGGKIEIYSLHKYP